MTWTGKRIRTDGKVESQPTGVSIGKYISKPSDTDIPVEDEIVEEWEGEAVEEPVHKKAKPGRGGFGNFDSW